MRLPLPRIAAFLLIALAAGLAAAPARADDDAAVRATTSAFLSALAVDDIETFCSLLTPQTLQRIGGAEKCREAFTESSQPDAEAMSTLIRAYHAAHTSAQKRKGQYVTKKFSAASLARDMQRIDKGLTVKLGRSPKAAAGQLATTVILDTRSTARQLVLYVESDDGSIFRLSAAQDDPDFREVAQGVPEVETAPPGPPEPSFQFAIDNVTFVSGGNAYVHVTLTETEDGKTETYATFLELAPSPGGYLVVTFYYSIFDALAAFAG